MIKKINKHILVILFEVQLIYLMQLYNYKKLYTIIYNCTIQCSKIKTLSNSIY